MSHVRLLLGLLAMMSLVGPAQAQNRPKPDGVGPDVIEHIFSRALTDVERAFYRRQSQVDPMGLRPLAPTALTDLQAYGFLPSKPNLHITLTGLDEERTRVCMQMQINSEALYWAAARLLTMPGVMRADSSCTPSTLVPRLQWPSTVYAVKDLDTADVMARTQLPSCPVITGVPAEARTVPALTMTAAPGEWSAPVVFTVTNTSGAALDLVQARVRWGFRVEHNCVAVPVQQSCSVSIRYFGSNNRYMVGATKLLFSDGNVAVVSLLGKRP